MPHLSHSSTEELVGFGKDSLLQFGHNHYRDMTLVEDSLRTKNKMVGELMSSLRTLVVNLLTRASNLRIWPLKSMNLPTISISSIYDSLLIS